jgi:glycosyltransferase involved in cell wall biosynthesis
MKLSIIVPAYNEMYTIEPLIERVFAAALPEGMAREVIVVDDASTDETSLILQAVVARYPDMRVVTHPRNQGKGAAIRTGVAQTTGDIVLIQDADLEYDPTEYCVLLAPILSGDADAVYGSRFLSGSCKRVLFFWHALGNRLLTLLSNICTGLDLTDMETCYKVVRGDTLRSLPLRCNRFGFEPELTAKLAKRKCRIYEVPISYRGRTYEEGKKIGWKDGIRALGVIVMFAILDDIYSEEYGRAILYRLSRTRHFNRWMADVIRPWVGQHVLEIGAGMGNMSRELLPRKDYVASDVDPTYLRYLKNAFWGSPNVRMANIDLVSSADFEGHRNAYDTIICLNVIEHVEDDRAAVANLFGALRAGGRLCLLTPRSQRLFGSLDVALEHKRRYTPAQLETLVKAGGFCVLDSFTFNRAAVPAWWFNGKVLKRQRFGRIQLKVYDSLIWILRGIDRFLPWEGLSVVVIAEKPLPGNYTRSTE